MKIFGALQTFFREFQGSENESASVFSQRDEERSQSWMSEAREARRDGQNSPSHSRVSTSDFHHVVCLVRFCLHQGKRVGTKLSD